MRHSQRFVPWLVVALALASLTLAGLSGTARAQEEPEEVLLGGVVASSLQLRTLGQGVRVTVAGLVVCRQRPLTAKGIVFLLLEDEYGLVNVLVNREMDESQTVLVRTALFLEVDGILEKRAGEQRTLVATALREVVPAQALTAPPGKSWG